MGVYIRGMEMPDCGYVCLKVFANGDVLMTKEHRGTLVITGINDKVGTAVPVPPHGRLGDLDALRARMYREAFETDSDMQRWESGCWIRYKMFERIEETAPTLIPAE